MLKSDVNTNIEESTNKMIESNKLKSKEINNSEFEPNDKKIKYDDELQKSLEKESNGKISDVEKAEENKEKIFESKENKENISNYKESKEYISESKENKENKKNISGSKENKENVSECNDNKIQMKDSELCNENSENKKTLDSNDDIKQNSVLVMENEESDKTKNNDDKVKINREIEQESDDNHNEKQINKLKIDDNDEPILIDDNDSDSDNKDRKKRANKKAHFIGELKDEEKAMVLRLYLERFNISQSARLFLNHLKGQGFTAREVFSEYCGKFNIPDGTTESSIWESVISFFRSMRPRRKLKEFNTLEHAIYLIRKAKNIIILTGAGVSVSCGIPDFRSENGIYAKLSKEFPDLPSPTAMFDMSFFLKNPKPFFQFAREIYPGNIVPSFCHRFIRQLEVNGQLLRNYTQNIDTLEQAAGIERVMQCHGSFATATCIKCKNMVTCEDIREDIFAKRIPMCKICKDGIIKPDIVFFGEDLGEAYYKMIRNDKKTCDLFICIGSSMKVRPVSLIPNLLKREIPQILINREDLPNLNFDVRLLGNADYIVNQICLLLQEPFINIPDMPSNGLVNEIQFKNSKYYKDESEIVSIDSDSSNSDTEEEYDTSLLSKVGGDTSIPSTSTAKDIAYKSQTFKTSRGLRDICDLTKEEDIKTLIEKPIDKGENITSILSDNSYMRIPPNTYVFEGAQVFEADLNMLQHWNMYPDSDYSDDEIFISDSSDDYDDDTYSDSSTSSSKGNISPKKSSEVIVIEDDEEQNKEDEEQNKEDEEQNKDDEEQNKEDAIPVKN